MLYRDHLGRRFAIRSSGRTWLWFVDDPRRDGVAIGVAATESDAVAEACALIEEMSEVLGDSICDTDLTERAMAAWQGVLSNLERYLISTRRAAA